MYTDTCTCTQSHVIYVDTNKLLTYKLILIWIRQSFLTNSHEELKIGD